MLLHLQQVCFLRELSPYLATEEGSGSKNGNITEIKSVDSETFNVLGIYATYKITVTGE